MSVKNRDFNEALNEAYGVLLGHLPSDVIQKHIVSINEDYQKLHAGRKDKPKEDNQLELF